MLIYTYTSYILPHFSHFSHFPFFSHVPRSLFVPCPLIPDPSAAKSNEELAQHVADLAAQVSVLEEERDVARQNEEELFETAMDAEDEIERLNQGYVWVTQELNDKRDEINDLEDQIQEWNAAAELARDDESSRISETLCSIHDQVTFKEIQRERRRAREKGIEAVRSPPINERARPYQE